MEDNNLNQTPLNNLNQNFNQAFNQSFNNFQQNLPNATAVLILGIVSISTCWCYGIIGIITGVIALILHSQDKRLLDSDPQRFTRSSVSSLNAGKICAIVGLVLSGLYLIYIVVVFAFYGSMFFKNFPWENM